jgi:hypothetical protein
VFVCVWVVVCVWLGGWVGGALILFGFNRNCSANGSIAHAPRYRVAAVSRDRGGYTIGHTWGSHFTFLKTPRILSDQMLMLWSQSH